MIDENENCAEGGSWRFNALEPPRPVASVRLYDGAPAGEWFDVVGWTGRLDRPVCGATVQKIDDSGAGVAYLITGGECGVRVKPAGDPAAWNVRNGRQRGAPYLIVPSVNDIKAGGMERSPA